MAHDRAGTGRWAWIKTVDAGDAPLRDDWLGVADGDEGVLVESSSTTGVNRRILNNVWFSQHPRSLKRGDLLVYYAAGSRERVFPAVVEVKTGDVLRSDGPAAKRWPWNVEVVPRIVVPSLALAPKLENIEGINPRTLRKSHSRLSAEQWERIRAAFLPNVEPFEFEPAIRASTKDKE